MIDITMKDETFSGEVIHEVVIPFAQEKTTIREIIASRVTVEVERHNQQLSTSFKSLITITQKEVKVDIEKQVYMALDAFQKNGFFVLIDNIQSTSLDQIVSLKPDTSISFLKLTPLVGG